MPTQRTDERCCSPASTGHGDIAPWWQGALQQSFQGCAMLLWHPEHQPFTPDIGDHQSGHSFGREWFKRHVLEIGPPQRDGERFKPIPQAHQNALSAHLQATEPPVLRSIDTLKDVGRCIPQGESERTGTTSANARPETERGSAAEFHSALHLGVVVTDVLQFHGR